MTKKLKSLVILLVAALIFSSCGKNDVVEMGSGYDIHTEGLVPAETPDEIPENAVFDMSIYTADGDLNGLSGVCIQPEGVKKPILITAFSPFIEHASIDITPADLPSYVQGGVIFDVTDGAKSEASIKNALLLPGLPERITRSDNLAAFSLQDFKEIKVFALAQEAPSMGEPVYLLSHKATGASTISSGVYPARALETADGLLNYSMEDGHDLSDCVGAPIVDSGGQLVGIHIGTRGDSGHEFQALSAGRIGEILADADE